MQVTPRRPASNGETNDAQPNRPRASHRAPHGRASRFGCGSRDYRKHLCDEEDEALYDLALTPCASDAEFIEKLRYLYAQQAGIWNLPDNGNDYGCIAIAAACHFYPVDA